MPFPKPPPAKPHPASGYSRRGSQTPSLQGNWLLLQGQSEDGSHVSRTPARSNGHLQLRDPEPVWEPPPYEATGAQRESRWWGEGREAGRARKKKSGLRRHRR